MTIDYHHLRQRRFEPVRQRYTRKDTLLYALSLGLGNDPLDAHALPFVYEGMPGGLRALPSQAAVLGSPGFWAREPDTGIDWVRLLHGEQRMRLHRPIPSEGEVIGRTAVTHLTDKGAGKSAVLVTERRLETVDSALLATIQQVTVLRGDGGYSQASPDAASGSQPSDEPLPALQPTPADRPPDITIKQAIRPEAALLYRLTGDDNPLHADPEVARRAGFDRPILHGLACYGMVAWAIVRHCCDGQPDRLASLDLRFTSPVHPGETLVTELWREQGTPQSCSARQGSMLSVRARVAERDTVVLSHGRAELRA